MELTDLRLYQACPILYEHRSELNLSELNRRPDKVHEDYVSLTEVIKRTVLICSRRMFSAEKKYDRKKIEKIWKTTFHSVFCPDEPAISENLARTYNQSLIVLHDLYPWLDSFEGRIIGINLPLTVVLYGKQLYVEVPLVLATNEGVSLVFFEDIFGEDDRRVFDPVYRFSALGVSENVNKVGKIIFLGVGTGERGPAFGSYEFYPTDKYWQSACRDFASLATSLDQNLLYPNLRHCLKCPRKKTCEYSNLERND